MSVFADLRVLYHMVFKRVRGATHADRLDSFYAGQAADYDDFRRRLLPGRAELCQEVSAPEGGLWVDMGGGTGANLEFYGPRLEQLGKVYVVDLASSLLKITRQRIEQRGWKNVEAVAADATEFTPPDGLADLITFSYSLTMIPDWFAAVENARRILRPGGQIGVVDFYVSRKYPPDSWARHGWSTRAFWPLWFGADNVYPSPDHVPLLHRAFNVQHFVEGRNKVPYLPLARAPYYRFIGRKPSAAGD